MASPYPASPTWGAALTWAVAALTHNGSPTPQLDALVLLMHATRAAQRLILAEPEHAMSPPEVTRYAEWVARRADGEPVAYIIGHRAFMGLDLLVAVGGWLRYHPRRVETSRELAEIPAER